MKKFIDKKMTREEFLKIAGFGIFSVLLLPGLKKLSLLKKPYKEARYYKELAG
jgi:hypothetical protein